MSGLKKIAIFLLAVLSIGSLYSNDRVKISASLSSYSIPIFYIKEYGLMGENIDFDIEIHKTRQEAVAKIIKDDIDLVYLGTQEIAQLYNKKIPIKFIAISNWATFRLITTDSTINNFNDLDGKEVWISGKGGPVDMVARDILGDRVIIKTMQVSELTQLALNELKEIKTFMLREPFESKVLLNNKNARVLYNFGDEWQKKYNMQIPQSGIAVTDNFNKKHPDLIRKFLDVNEIAIKWTKENPDKAAELGAKYLKGFTKEEIRLSLDVINLNTGSPSDYRASIEKYLSIYPDITLPDNDFYQSYE